MIRASLRLALAPIVALAFVLPAHAQKETFDRTAWNAQATAATRGLKEKVNACQQKAVDAGRDPKGTLTVSWAVGRDGKVASAHVVSSTVKDPQVERCVEDAVRALTYPPRGDEEAFVPMSQSFTLTVKKVEKKKAGPTTSKEEREEEPE